uniref:Uncharacterized protein n=1 Tax=Mycena chlorophos TaxID=658473 RepID=A0ABQ0L8Q2_MYCCL|nr:predicted protein [Mycena chlorophos]
MGFSLGMSFDNDNLQQIGRHSAQGSNVFVAGRLILATLLVEDRNKWVSSDIDLYIDGTAATAKIQHIFGVYKRNLPKGAPKPLVVRNSQTITFYSQYPTRRLQIVFKLVKSPKDVLLNFDLDICAAVHAASMYQGLGEYVAPCYTTSRKRSPHLTVGFNVFTMNLIQGHYLSERRASQEQRVFKYACRGYGVLILPSYVESLRKSEKSVEKNAHGEAMLTPLNLPSLANEVRRWTKRVIRNQFGDSITECDHSVLENGDQITSETQHKSCLSGFMLFMRHVALVDSEMEHRGELKITSEQFPETTYNDLEGIPYDDTRRRVHGGLRTQDWLAPLKCVTYGPSVVEVLKPKNSIRSVGLIPENFAEWVNEKVELAFRESWLKGRRATILEPAAEYDEEEEDEEPGSDSRCYFCCSWQQLDRPIDEIFEVLYAFHRCHDRCGGDRGDDLCQERFVSALCRSK